MPAQDTKITALAAIATVDPAADVLPIVDISDTSMAASGTTKKITSNQILGAGGTATLASATITGDLTVATSVLKVDTANTRVGINTTTINGGPFNVKISSAIDAKFVIQDGFTTGNVRLAAVDNAYSTYKIMDYSALSHAWYNSGTTAMTLNSTGLGVGVVPVAARLQLAYTEVNTIPAAGATTGHNFAFGSTVFGLAGGSLSTGDSYLQSTRWDGTATNYNLLLNPNGGNVGIGVTPATAIANNRKLEIGGSVNSAVVLSSNSAISATRNWAVASSWNGYGDLVFLQSNALGGDPLASSAGTTRMMLDATGNLLVGKAANYGAGEINTLQLKSSVIFGSDNTGSASNRNWSIGTNVSGAGNMEWVISSTNTGIPNYAYRMQITSAGDVNNTTGTYGTISDLRLKENVSDARNYLADLLKLRVVKYSLKEESSAVATKLGFIAQEVEQVFPNLVDQSDKEYEGAEGIRSVKTSILIPMLLKAIQELTARVQTLEAK